jgi:hypothetical protein
VSTVSEGTFMTYLYIELYKNDRSHIVLLTFLSRIERRRFTFWVASHDTIRVGPVATWSSSAADNAISA